MNDYFFISNKGNALNALKEAANWILLAGLALVLLGVLAIIYSFTSTILSIVYLGVILFFDGIMEMVKSFTVKKWATFFLHLFLSIIYVIGGVFIIAYPAINAITLTLFFAILFGIAGIYKMIFAVTKELPHATWLFLSGALSFLLGILIWQQWPVSGLWVLGTFIGIDMLFTGWTWIMLALAAKHIAK